MRDRNFKMLCLTWCLRGRDRPIVRLHPHLLSSHRAIAIGLVPEITDVLPFGQRRAGISIATGSQWRDHQEPCAG